MSIRSYLTNEGDHGDGPVPSFFMLCWLRWRALNQSSCGQASFEDRLSYPVQLTLLLNLNTPKNHTGADEGARTKKKEFSSHISIYSFRWHG